MSKHCIFPEFFLIERCSTKGVARCSFPRALSNRFFGKVLLIHFASAWNNLLKCCISDEILLMECYVQGARRIELLIAPFVEHFKPTTLGESQ